MERCSISPVTRFAALICLLLTALLTQPSTCKSEEDEEQVDSLSVQLSVNSQVTPTPLWAVVWGPTQQLDEDATYHLLSSQETDQLHLHRSQQEVSTVTPGDWVYLDSSVQPQEKAPLESRNREREEDGRTEAEETEPEEVDPQFYVTVTISSLLILTAVIITAKLWTRRGGQNMALIGYFTSLDISMASTFDRSSTASHLDLSPHVDMVVNRSYDRSCSQHPPPLSRGVAPPLSLALPRSLAAEDSRQTLHSTSSSFTDRERIPVVNL